MRPVALSKRRWAISPADLPARSASNAKAPWLGAVLHLACALPLVGHVLGLLSGLAGPDPLTGLVHGSGHWALVGLLATLTITPLRRASVWLARRAAVRFGRRLSDWNFLVRHRRALGLWSFFYACVHVTLHAVLEAGSLHEWLHDVGERRFVQLGLAAFVLLVPLAVTSTRASMRRLKRHWTHLHTLVYPAVALALLHAWWQTKHGHEPPVALVAVGAALLAARLVAWWAGDRGRAEELAGRG